MLLLLHAVLFYYKMKICFHQLPYNKTYPLPTDGAQPVSTSITSRNGLQMSQTVVAPAAETLKKKPSSARPRPDHLPLGSQDPRAHPLYLGVASLTGKFVRLTTTIIIIMCIYELATFQKQVIRFFTLQKKCLLNESFIANIRAERHQLCIKKSKKKVFLTVSL